MDSTARLLEAAAAVISERGYDGAGVAEIARRAGLTTGAIYGRYTGKAELLMAAVAMHMVDEVQELLDNSEGDATAVDVISSLGADLLEVDERPTATLLVEAFAAAQREPALADVLRGGFKDEGLRLAKLIDEGQTDGYIDPELDVDSIVTLCHAVGLGFMLLHSVQSELPEPAAWNHLIERLISTAIPSTEQQVNPTDTPKV